MEPIRLAHLSDPHFASVTYSPRQFFSKRWLGNTNLILFRKKAYQTDHLKHIPELLETLDVETVFITGDVATTSRDEEFAKAAAFASKFKQPVHLVPGNHDCYTRGSDREKRFYRYFPEPELQEQRVVKKKLGKGWWWIGLDCALATALIFSYGRFFEEMEKKLEEAISLIPSDEGVVISNHFPLFGSGNPRHDLRRNKSLQKILRRFPQVKLYLHGHDHSPYIIDRTREGYPLVINSGSCAHQPNGIFYLMDLDRTGCLVERCVLKQDNSTYSWVIESQKRYHF